MTETTLPRTTQMPGWLNRIMRLLLTTPGVQRVLGRSVALLSFRGSKTGRTYTTPVSYHRHDDTVVVLTRVSRRWWRNLEHNPRVRIRLAGRTRLGHATAARGSEDDLYTLLSFLKGRRLDARAYGVSLGPQGAPDINDVRRLLDHIVVIRIDFTR